MRLEINYGGKICKKHKHVEAKKMLLNNQWITEEITGEIKKNAQRLVKMKAQWPKTQECNKAILGGKLIAKQSYLKEQEKSQINNLNLHISQPEKEKNNET